MRKFFLLFDTDAAQPTAELDVRVPGASWYLGVYNPEINEVENMRDGLIAMIVICAFMLSGASSGRRIAAQTD